MIVMLLLFVGGMFCSLHGEQCNFYNMKKHYDTIGLKSTSSDQEVKKTCRKKRQEYHPDKQRNKSPAEQKTAHEMLEKINDACDCIEAERLQPKKPSWQEQKPPQYKPPKPKEPEPPLTPEEHLCRAVAHRNVSQVEALLKQGISPNILCLPAFLSVGESPPNALLFEAITHFNEEVIQLVLKYDVKVDVRMSTKGPGYQKGITPLHMLMRRGGWLDVRNIIKLFIKDGANVNAQDSWGRTPLFNARDKESAQLLIDHGADINARDFSGERPLFGAYGTDVVLLLLELGAKVNAQNDMGRTPLSQQIYLYDRDQEEMQAVLTALLDWGADINILDFGILEDRQSMIQIIRERKPNAADFIENYIKTRKEPCLPLFKNIIMRIREALHKNESIQQKIFATLLHVIH